MADETYGFDAETVERIADVVRQVEGAPLRVARHRRRGIAISDSSGLVIRKNSGADVGTRPRLNFIEGTGINLTVSDDAGDDEVDVTIASGVPAGSTEAAGGNAGSTSGTTGTMTTILDVSASGILGVIGIKNTGATWGLNIRTTLYSAWGSSNNNYVGVSAGALRHEVMDTGASSIGNALTGPWNRITVEVEDNNPGNHTTYDFKWALVLA